MTPDFIMMRHLCQIIAVEIIPAYCFTVYLMFGDGEVVDLCMN